MKEEKINKFIRDWSKCRQEGKDKYIFKRSLYAALGVLLGSSIAWLLKGQFIFFDFANLFLMFTIAFVSTCIGATRTWNKSETKYKALMDDNEV